MNKDTELKAYKLLAQIRQNMLIRIRMEAKNKVQYCQDNPEEFKTYLEYISSPARWDYCGILSKEDQAVLETLEYLLNDNMTIINRYT